jgi:hypothetical protein
MGIFAKAVAYTAHKTTKVAKGSGGFVKNFVSEVKADMKTFDEIESTKAAEKAKDAEIRKKANEGSLKLEEFASYMEDKFAE